MAFNCGECEDADLIGVVTFIKNFLITAQDSAHKIGDRDLTDLAKSFFGKPQNEKKTNSERGLALSAAI